MQFLKSMKKHVMKTNRNITRKSFLIIVYDLLFYLAALVGIRIYAYAMRNSLMLLQSPELFGFTSNLTSKPLLETSLDVLYRFYAQIFLYTVLIAVFLLVIWSLSRYLIWLNISQKKFRAGVFLKFIPVNLLWLIIMLIPVIVLMLPFLSFVEQSGGAESLTPGLAALRYLMVFMVVIIFYFTNMMHLNYIRTARFRSIINAFREGVSSYNPALMYLAVTFAVSLISLVTNMLGGFGTIIQLIILVCAFSWVKIYLYSGSGTS